MTKFLKIIVLKKLKRYHPSCHYLPEYVKNIMLKNCVATANRSATGNKGGKAYSAGFLASTVEPAMNYLFWGGEENTFIDCVADGNTTNRVPLHQHKPFPHADKGVPVVGDPLTGAGFILDNQDKTKIINCVSVNNHGQGIWLIGSKNSLIQGNTISGNTALGINDDNPTGPNKIVGNTLSMNGKGPADAIRASDDSQSDNRKY